MSPRPDSNGLTSAVRSITYVVLIETDMGLVSDAEEPYTTIAQDILPYKLDCLALSQKHDDLLAFASYEIDPEDNTKRFGRLYLALLDPSFAVGYELLQTIENIPGVLDMKWEPSEERRLVIATSERVIVYSLENPVPRIFQLSEVFSHSTGQDMALYIQWMNPTDLIFSDSDGKINVWTTDPTKFYPDEETEELSSKITSAAVHDYFVWFVHFDHESNTVYSGDDVGVMCMFHIDNIKSTAYQRRRRFDTGITSILTKGDLVAVGCYDEHLRIFTQSIDSTTKQVTLSQPLLEMDIKGTVWRTMWIPPLIQLDSDILVVEESNPDVYKMAIAAGRNGIHVVTFNRSDWTWDTTFCCLEFKEKLAYGIDIKPNSEEYTVATCYFDMNCLHVFTMKP